MAASRPLAVLCGLYIAQAIPLYLVAAAMPPILRARGIDLALIGSFGVLMAPWAFKFLWAPLVDRFGTRRGWILSMQAIALIAIALLAQLDPGTDIALFFPILMVLSVAAATQDIATDGYAVEHLPPERQTLGGAIQGGSIAVGVLLGGSLTLFVYDQTGWTVALSVAMILSAASTLPVLLVSESEALRSGMPAHRRPSFRSFWARPDARAILGLALLFRVPEGLVKAVELAFLVDVGFSLTKIGLISGGAAALVGLAGSALGVFVIKRIGVGPFLWAIVLVRTACFAGYLWAAQAGMPETALIALSALNTFSRYMEIVGLYTAFLRVSSLDQAGTDFTILASANLLTYTFGSMLAGVFASAFGYAPLFALATALSLVTGVLALRLLPPPLSSPERSIA